MHIHNWYLCCGIGTYFMSTSRVCWYRYQYLTPVLVMVHPYSLPFHFTTTAIHIEVKVWTKKYRVKFSKRASRVSARDFIFSYLCMGKIYGTALVSLTDSLLHGNNVRGSQFSQGADSCFCDGRPSGVVRKWERLLLSTASSAHTS